MRFFCRHWYNIGGIAAAITLVILIAQWSNIDTVRRLLIISFIAILVHQFEEYGLPGGEPAIMNIMLQSSDIPDRYPLNQFSAMFTNVTAIALYFIPIFLPKIIWLGLAPILMGMTQIMVHFVIPAKQYRMFYTPGLGAVICIHWPLGIYYIWYMTTHGGIGLQWVGGIIYLAVIMGFVAISTYVLMANRNTKWVFDPKEMERFHVPEKLERRGITIVPGEIRNPVLKKIRSLNQKRNA